MGRDLVDDPHRTARGVDDLASAAVVLDQDVPR
jgi:hypothetical protein